MLDEPVVCKLNEARRLVQYHVKRCLYQCLNMKNRTSDWLRIPICKSTQYTVKSYCKALFFYRIMLFFCFLAQAVFAGAIDIKRMMRHSEFIEVGSIVQHCLDARIAKFNYFATGGTNQVIVLF